MWYPSGRLGAASHVTANRPYGGRATVHRRALSSQSISNHLHCLEMPLIRPTSGVGPRQSGHTINFDAYGGRRRGPTIWVLLKQQPVAPCELKPRYEIWFFRDPKSKKSSRRGPTMVGHASVAPALRASALVLRTRVRTQDHEYHIAIVFMSMSII